MTPPPGSATVPAAAPASAPSVAPVSISMPIAVTPDIKPATVACAATQDHPCENGAGGAFGALPVPCPVGALDEPAVPGVALVPVPLWPLPVPPAAVPPELDPPWAAPEQIPNIIRWFTRENWLQ